MKQIIKRNAFGIAIFASVLIAFALALGRGATVSSMFTEESSLQRPVRSIAQAAAESARRSQMKSAEMVILIARLESCSERIGCYSEDAAADVAAAIDLDLRLSTPQMSPQLTFQACEAISTAGYPHMRPEGCMPYY